MDGSFLRQDGSPSLAMSSRNGHLVWFLEDVKVFALAVANDLAVVMTPQKGN